MDRELMGERAHIKTCKAKKDEPLKAQGES